MLLSILLQRLPSNSYKVLASANIDHEIYVIKMLTSKQSEYQKDTLYFGQLSAFSQHAVKEGPMNLFLFGDDSEIEDLSDFDHHYNLISLTDKIDPFHAYNLLQDVFLEEHSTGMMLKRLLNALVSNNGIDYMADEAYKVFGNPFFIVDNSYRYIAKNIGEDKVVPGSHYEKIIRQEMEIGSILEEGIDFIRDHDIDTILSEVQTPYYFYNEVYKQGSLLLPIRVHNIEVGHMMLLEEFRPFTSVDKDIFYRFGFLVAQELQKSAFYSSNKGQLFSYFLIDLLKAESPSLHNITRRLNMLKYTLHESMTICTIAISNQDNLNKKLHILTQQLQKILTGHIYAIFNQQLVILFNLNNNLPLSDYCINTLEKVARINSLLIGFSNPFSNVTDVKNYYHQSTKTINYAISQSKDSGIFYYKDFTYYEMLNICQSQINLIDFCDPDLLRLLDYDKEHHSDMTLTLYHYLHKSANSIKAAKALFIHKNTLLYRLDKIRKILNNSLSDGDDLFKYHMSFRTLIYLGLFSPDRVINEKN